ncbi:MAG: sugar transferase [Chloroflexi bacterium]|nr:sugar transferase [Chloroflexota bacterium]
MLRARSLYPWAIAAGDIILVNLAFLLAYAMRYEWDIGGEVGEEFYVSLGELLRVQITFTAVLPPVFYLGGLYRPVSRVSTVDAVIKVLGATSIGMMLVLAVVYLYQGFAYSRALFVFTWVLIAFFLSSARAVRRLTVAYLQSKGIGLKRVLVVGGATLGRMVMHVLTTEPGLGYHLVGFVQCDGADGVGRFKCLGEIGDIDQLCRDHAIDEIIIALPSSSHREVPQILEHCRKEGVRFRIVPDLYEVSLTRVDIDDLRGVPLLGVKDVSIRGANFWAKRAFDIILTFLLFIPTSPLWMAIALAIVLDSPGPVFFKQLRLGRGGKPFYAYKFRSMKENAEEERRKLEDLNEADGPIFKIRNDPRVTRVGRILRRTSFDELPQLINVIKGEMSLVGPRPPIPEEVENYQPWHRKRLETAPGITGLWQVSGRSELPFDEMVMLDIYYIENWSLGLDMTTLLRTIPAVLTAKGAY